METQTIKCEWKIKDVMRILKSNESVTSEYFHTKFNQDQDLKWRFIFACPPEERGFNKEHTITLEIKKMSCIFDMIQVNVQTYLLARNNDEQPLDGHVLTILPGNIATSDLSHYIKTFLDKYSCGEEGRYLVNNSLVFRFTLIFWFKIAKKPENKPLAAVVTTVIDPSKKYKTLSKNLAKSFIQGEFTDFEIRTSSERFYCHKFILSARSSVFCTMLKCEMKEGLENCIEITDFDAQTVKKMLEYIYSGNIEQNELDLELLKISHKYDLSELKEICEVELCKKISSENFLKLLEHAELYDSKTIKTVVFNYIKSNKDSLSKNKDFKELAKSNPAFIAQLYFEEMNI